ncbi:hypothetical protein [Nocardia amikacinitolerans]|uniref:hypothetical protein n=1 Tax=Nocardia amikacinitolerans TaxID=756689 RepID=UPI0020A3BF3E|nr:hypothetical protein [Nocardia amikacinitolerans]
MKKITGASRSAAQIGRKDRSRTARAAEDDSALASREIDRKSMDRGLDLGNLASAYAGR